MFNNARPALTKTAMLQKLAASGVRPVTSRLAGRNTLDYTLANLTRKIRLHDTDILTFYPDGAIEIYTGGFNTMTTRSRLNEFLPAGYSVATSKGVLYLTNRIVSVAVKQLANIDPDGTLRSDLTPSRVKQIEKSLNAFMKAWKMEGLPEDSAGDPFVGPNPATGKYAECMTQEWVNEKYVFLTYYVNALRFHGLAERTIAYFMSRAYAEGLDRMDLQRIRRYTRANLGLES